jgi:hypothetical protein
MAFRFHAATLKTPSPVSTGTHQHEKKLPSIPAGVTESRVHAAAAEWLEVHACVRGAAAQRSANAASDASAQPPCSLATSVAPGADCADADGTPASDDIFVLLQQLLSSHGDVVPSLSQLSRVHAMGMADLPPEASPMQLYEWLAGTEHMMQELEHAAIALRKSGEGVVSGVRSGFRGGVEAIRGGERRRRCQEQSSQYTRVHRTLYLPLVCKGYRRGDDPKAIGARAETERLEAETERLEAVTERLEAGLGWRGEWSAVGVQEDGCESEWFVCQGDARSSGGVHASRLRGGGANVGWWRWLASVAASLCL